MIGFQNSLESTIVSTLKKQTVYFASSLQVPLGVQLRNENKPDDMGKILEELHIKYVPTNRLKGEQMDTTSQHLTTLSSFRHYLVGIN